MSDNINYSLTDMSGKTFPFTSLRNLKRFIETEIGFWSTQKDIFNNVASQLQYLNAGDQFRNFFQKLNELVIESKSLDVSETNQRLESLNHSYLRNINSYWLWHGHPYVTPLISCIEKYGADAANGFLAYTYGKSLGNINQKNFFAGSLAAFEFFDAPDEHTKRKSGEKISLTQLRTRFEEAQDELFSEVEALKEDAKRWTEQSKRKQIKRYQAQKAISAKLYERAKGEFKSQMDQWNSEFTNLRKVYEDHLKLEAPAKYWNDAAKKFKTQGIACVAILIAIVVLGVVKVSSVLETWMLKGETPLSLNSIQGIVLFGSLAAIFAYGVRVLSRMAFSSFHLMRDAEERHQLTHLYLSLINETESDERAREIILQALFSRSETGLLVTENGPTMPGIRELARGVSRPGAGGP